MLTLATRYLFWAPFRICHRQCASCTLTHCERNPYKYPHTQNTRRSLISMHTHVAPAENHYNGDLLQHTLCVCRSVCTSLTYSGVECVALLMELFSLPSDKQKKKTSWRSLRNADESVSRSPRRWLRLYLSITHRHTHLSPRTLVYVTLRLETSLSPSFPSPLSSRPSLSCSLNSREPRITPLTNPQTSLPRRQRFFPSHILLFPLSLSPALSPPASRPLAVFIYLPCRGSTVIRLY